MTILLAALLLVVGFVLLIKGADIFVDAASSLAEIFKMPKTLIGLTIVAFGTSAPEFAVSVSALASGNTDVVLGNVIGSCILNILLILGIAALIRPIKIRTNTVNKELPLCLLISALLAVLFLDSFLGVGSINQITRADAIVILLFFSVFLYYLVAMARTRKTEDEASDPKFTLGRSCVFVVLGLAGIIVGSELVVNNAVTIAEALGMSERLVSLTVIAFGTSLPELVTTVVAAKKGEQDMAVGNIIGSNVFNICVVLGLPVAIFGTVTPVSFQILDLVALVGSALILFIFAFGKRQITRLEGGIMLALFCAYFVTILCLPA